MMFDISNPSSLPFVNSLHRRKRERNEIEIERDCAKIVLAYPGLSPNQLTQLVGLSPKVAKEYLRRLHPLLILQNGEFKGRKGRKAVLAIYAADGLADHLQDCDDFLGRRQKRLDLS